jgi:hypothetical protein
MRSAAAARRNCRDDNNDGMEPRLARHGILYQPRLGVGIEM